MKIGLMVLGALAGCVPAALSYVSLGGGGDAQGGMLILILLIVNAPIGAVFGLLGANRYGTNTWTGASPSLGVAAGSLLSVVISEIASGPWFLASIGLAPAAGGLAVLFIAAVGKKNNGVARPAEKGGDNAEPESAAVGGRDPGSS